jgi:c(7)-type cytochrome triheme protein
MNRRTLRTLALLLVLWLWPGCSSAWGGALGDIVYSRRGGSEALAPAYFPHWVHRIAYKCYACHDALFPMRRGPNPTMSVMTKGESCGACHNAKIAFGVDACHRCHVRQ